ncbi:SEL1-like repeat protein [Curvivirga aplysinae]|uniref:sel1 repeat family protein n=1 Tax=Curvivirga aplysinae TaxID=2529852 RepID=UPI0012BB9170|nr:sel1 repeat family protein [Curvivirga aplysinae]MTI11160.1 sel1 repeat family protein [Curvivirga aplysinae]
MRLKFCALLLLYLGLTSPAFAGFEEGKAAYDAGDFETAKQEWLPLAKAGDAEAQFWMGKLYHPSKKEFIDIDQAIYWYSLAAEQNYKKAQKHLSAAYVFKRPASKYIYDVIKWAIIVYRQHNDPDLKNALNALKESIPIEIYNDGVKMGEEWLDSHSNK